MATKAEEFRAEAQRSGAKRAKAPDKPAPEPRLSHNDARRLDRKSAYAIEQTGKRASRKSTRGSSNRAKPDSALRITARVRNASPEARAQRRSGNPQ
jgi:hypothetical protein